jgi:DtxR family Mn-dependent transcriptional regulator
MDDSLLSASLEDYLEAIYLIIGRKKAARAKDIAGHLGVNGSSVTGALHALAERKLVNYAPYEIVTLTPEGERLAAGISRRHEVLRDFFVKVLGIDEQGAEQSACRMEHAVSPEILSRLAEFVDFIHVCPRIDVRWIEETRYFCERPDSPERCERCIEGSLEALRRKRGGPGAAQGAPGKVGGNVHG